MKITVARASTLSRWDVKFIGHADWSWSQEGSETFGSVAKRRTERVHKDRLESELLPLASIHFDGSITRRDADARRLAGNLFFAHPGDLVFSKIDVRNGAIGVVPDELGTVVFTGEFPVYDFASKGRLRAGFVKLLCRTAAFRARVNALAVGHSGRKRVPPEAMEGLLIPVPDLDRQDEILAELERLLRRARDLEVEALQRQSGVADFVLERLGIEDRPFRHIAKPFVVRSKHLDRWSVVRAMMAVQGMSEDPLGLYPFGHLGDSRVATVSYGVTKSPANRPTRYARPYLRVANVQAGRLDLRVIKTIDVPDSEMEKYRLIDGDLLLCEGNSLELVGRPALWRGEIDDCVHQNHVIRVRLNKLVLDPNFVLVYMNTPPARRYMFLRAKRTTNLASINSTDVAEFPVPIPPMDVQNAIVRDVTQRNLEAETLLREAGRLRREAFKEAERQAFL